MGQEQSALVGDGRHDEASFSRESSRTLSPEPSPEANGLQSIPNAALVQNFCSGIHVDLTNVSDDVEIPSAEIIDLEAEEEVAIEEEIARVATHQQHGRRDTLKRNLPVNFPLESLQSYPFHQYTLRRNKVVEYQGEAIQYTKEGFDPQKKQWGMKDINCFLVVQNIVRNTITGEVNLRGWRSIRTIDLMGKLETGKGTKNELCYFHEVETDDHRDMWEQSVHELPIDAVIRIRQVKMTNKSRAEAPELRYSEADLPCHLGDATKREKNQYMEEEERMVLRWVFIVRYQSARERKNYLSTSSIFETYTLRPLLEEECTNGLGKLAEVLRSQWRQDVTQDNETDLIEINASGSKKYSFFDSFCGAGGVSRGAQDAGMKLSHAFDNWDEAERTYRANFPRANMMNLTVDQFCSPEQRGNYVSDILHLSCPCQYYSPNNTRRGTARNDESNQAASFCVDALLKKIRPRFVHSEQTFGILRPAHSQDFNMFLSQFTDRGFSVSWQVRDFKRDGLPQPRRRLLVNAAAPGETLPDFPPYTHSDNPLSSLKPFTTVRDVFSRIPRTAPSHNIAAAFTGRKYPVWDPNTIFPHTVCTVGLMKTSPKPATRLGHPSGDRMVTIIELASIQGVPPHHRFEGRTQTTNLKLIGNMYPPIMAEIQFRNLRKHLEETDKKRRAQGVVGV